MGCLEKQRSLRDFYNIPREIFETLPEKGAFDMKKIPIDQYLCPKCKKNAELLYVHLDNGEIELKCKYDGKINLKITDYFNKIKNSPFNYYNTKCHNCEKVQKDEIMINEENNQMIINNDNIFRYCYKCKTDFCSQCIENYADHKPDHPDIPINEKLNRCLEHDKEEVSEYCEDCEENIICKKNIDRHQGHKTIKLKDLEMEAIISIEKIREKNQMLTDIIRFNQIIINSYNQFPNNYYNIKGVINLWKSLSEQGKRNSKKIDNFIKGLEKSSKKQEEALNELLEKRIVLNGKEDILNLSNWEEEVKEKINKEKNQQQENDENQNLNFKIENKDLQLISKIQFRQLRGIDISNNKIKNIEFLNNMNLPDLKFFDASHNNIDKIGPIAELNCKEIQVILLNDNEIKDISAFQNSDFPVLEILRVDSNKINESDFNFNIIKKKYEGKLIYKEFTFGMFKKKYKRFLLLNDEKIEDEKEEEEKKNKEEKILKDLKSIEISGLNDPDKGKEMLKDLYLILPKKNNLRKLKIDNNGLQNLSLFERFSLPKLKELDLSLNKINNLKFLYEMKKLSNLNTLFLNANKINDITPLFKFVIPSEENKKENNKNVDDKSRKKIKIISIKENNFVAKNKIDDNEIYFVLDEDNIKMVDDLQKKKEIAMDVEIEIKN